MLKFENHVFVEAERSTQSIRSNQNVVEPEIEVDSSRERRAHWYKQMLQRRGARINSEPYQMALMTGPQDRTTPQVNPDIQRIHFSPNPYG